MPKLSTRTTLTVLIVLGVVFAIFATVQSASAGRSETGSHLVSEAMVNLNHDRLTSTERETFKAELDSFHRDSRDGGGCESENHLNPNDY